MNNNKFILGVLYSNPNKLLTVYFNSGSTFRYSNVPQKTYQEFLTAKSQQSYYASNIKGKYSSIKIR